MVDKEKSKKPVKRARNKKKTVKKAASKDKSKKKTVKRAGKDKTKKKIWGSHQFALLMTKSQTFQIASMDFSFQIPSCKLIVGMRPPSTLEPLQGGPWWWRCLGGLGLP